MATPHRTYNPERLEASQAREAAAMRQIQALPKRPPQLNETNMVLAEFHRQLWAIAPDVGVTVEQVRNPLYLVHVAGKLKVGDKFEVIPKDRAYYAELLVVRVDKLAGVETALLRHVPLQHSDLAGDDDLAAFDIEYAGTSDKWRAIRKADKQLIATGHETRDQLVAELRGGRAAAA